ncbi:hypothetical protein NMY22_g19531 [Coprinellus aureogranulatus]|nr:hypothetical protein NMY22_g19531 [Coprinellus aureogranulatus]
MATIGSAKGLKGSANVHKAQPNQRQAGSAKLSQRSAWLRLAGEMAEPMAGAGPSQVWLTPMAGHPLRLLAEAFSKQPKRLACWLTPLKREKVQDAISQTAKVLPKLTESFQPCAEEAAPGTRLMDLYADQVDFNVFNKRWENALDVCRTELNTIWNSAQVQHDALLIGMDVSVPKDKHFQVVAAYCWEGLDDYELEPGCVLAGRVLSTDAEPTAIRFAICRAVLRPGCSRIVLFTDLIAMARWAVDPSVHSGQAKKSVIWKVRWSGDGGPPDLRPGPQVHRSGSF